MSHTHTHAHTYRTSFCLFLKGFKLPAPSFSDAIMLVCLRDADNSCRAMHGV